MTVQFTKASSTIALASAANFINAADRVIMPIAIIQMTDEFKWDLHGQGWVLSAFAVGYMSSMVRFDLNTCRAIFGIHIDCWFIDSFTSCTFNFLNEGDWRQCSQKVWWKKHPNFSGVHVVFVNFYYSILCYVYLWSYFTQSHFRNRRGNR